jgi:hypothetical protein
MIFALLVLAVGALFSWLAVLGWRRRREEQISLLEAAVLKTTGAEPLPLTRFDRALQRFQLVMMSLFGPGLMVLGAVALLVETGAL